MSPDRNFVRKISFGAGGVIVLYFVATFAAGGDLVLGAISRVGGEVVVTILCLSLFNLLVRFARWAILVGSGRENAMDMLWGYLAGYAFSFTPGKLGEVVRGIFLKRHGISHELNLSLFVCERSLDLIAVLAMAALGPLYIGGGGGVFVFLSAIATLAVFMLALCSGFFDRVRKRTTESNLKIVRFMHFVLGALARGRHLLFSRRAAIGLLLGLGAWSASAFGLCIIVQSQGYEFGFLQSVGIFGLSMLGAALAGIVGGIGGAESVMVLALTTAGIFLPEAIAVTMISRVTTIGFSVSVGVLALFIADRACKGN